MSVKKSKTKKSALIKTLHKWHSYLGVTASLFILNLAITGIILNHSETLALQNKYIKSSWILDWYGVKSPQKIDCHKYRTIKICQLGEQIFVIDKQKKIHLLLKNTNRLIDALENSSELFLVSSHTIYIYNQQLELIEAIDTVAELSSATTQAITFNNQLIIYAGKKWWSFDENNFEFIPTPPPPLEAYKSRKFKLEDPQLKLQLSEKYRQSQISLLKLVQDLHSGRLFFNLGKRLIDLTGIILIFLVLSGFYAWSRRKSAKKGSESRF